jgi:hypothetical protein
VRVGIVSAAQKKVGEGLLRQRLTRLTLIRYVNRGSDINSGEPLPASVAGIATASSPYPLGTPTTALSRGRCSTGLSLRIPH